MEKRTHPVDEWVEDTIQLIQQKGDQSGKDDIENRYMVVVLEMLLSLHQFLRILFKLAFFFVGLCIGLLLSALFFIG